MNTRVPVDEDILRAVDFFIAGVERDYQDGGIVGVHSWSDGRVEGLTYPKMLVRDLYLTIMRTWGFQRTLLFLSMRICSYDGMHEMTREEMVFYGLLIE